MKLGHAGRYEPGKRRLKADDAVFSYGEVGSKQFVGIISEAALTR